MTATTIRMHGWQRVKRDRVKAMKVPVAGVQPAGLRSACASRRGYSPSLLLMGMTGGSRLSPRWSRSPIPR